MKKRLFALFLAAALLGMLSGCLKSTEELYRLPKQSDEYLDLQEAISGVLSTGAEYCAPVSGANQQAVQLADLDGDGADEAIAFVKTSGEMPLKAYIFDKLDDAYQPIAVIEGNGSSFESVEYVQLDGVGGLELVIGWQVSNQVLRAIAAYSLRPDGVVELMSANYSAYRSADLDGDGLSEMFLLRDDAEAAACVAEFYDYRDGQMERAPEAALSARADAVKRIVSGFMEQDVPAVFVSSVQEADGVSFIVTDVFALRHGVFQNVTLQGDGDRISAVRNYFVYATDIDQDGLMELPNPIQLPTYGTEQTEPFWVIQWYNLSLDGKRELKQTTYHNYSGGWYVVLQSGWDNLVVYRGNAIGSVSTFTGYVFALWNGTDAPQELFTIYTFSGDSRGEIASADGRFVLAQKGDVTYSAKLGGGQSRLTPDRLRELFRFIKVDWITGEM